jgi:hypothetical protein
MEDVRNPVDKTAIRYWFLFRFAIGVDIEVDEEEEVGGEKHATRRRCILLSSTIARAWQGVVEIGMNGMGIS